MSFSNRTWNMWHMTLALKGKYEYNLMCEKIYAVLNDYQYMAAALLRTPPNVFPIFYNETGWTFTGMKWVCFGISYIFLLNIIWNFRKIVIQECEKTIEHGIILFHPLYFIPKMGLMHFLFYLHFKICWKQSCCSKVKGIACLQQFTIFKLLELTNFALDHPVLYTYMNCDQRTWPLTHF